MHDILQTDRPTLIIELHVIKGDVPHATHDEVAALLTQADYEYELIDTDRPRDDGGPARGHILATPTPASL
jgi:hypothetical protein